MLRRTRFLFALLTTAATVACSSETPVDFTAAAGFSSPSACIFMPQAEHAFDDMLHATDEAGGMRSDPFITIDGRKYSVIATRNISRAEETYHYSATAGFPAGSRWHGLALLSISTEERFTLGKDGVHGRWLTFAEPIERVRHLVRHYDVPLNANDRAFLDVVDGRGCEGQLRLRRLPQSTEMRCEWGC